jgi:hypothetical protein
MRRPEIYAGYRPLSIAVQLRFSCGTATTWFGDLSRLDTISVRVRGL